MEGKYCLLLQQKEDILKFIDELVLKGASLEQLCLVYDILNNITFAIEFYKCM